MKAIKQTKTFEVGQIAYCNGGCTMQLPTFYKVVRRTDKTVWLQEIDNQLIEHDGYGQRGRKIPVDIPAVESTRVLVVFIPPTSFAVPDPVVSIYQLNDVNLS